MRAGIAALAMMVCLGFTPCGSAAVTRQTPKTHRYRPRSSAPIGFLMLLAACTPMQSDKRLTASDGARISYDYYPAEGKLGVILIHQMRSDKDAWEPFATTLQMKDKVDVIAIDLRGHGESDGTLAKFTEKDFAAMRNDVKAAADYLRGKGIKRIAIIGASIGANHALNYGVEDPSVVGMALLSPGLDYRGVKTEDAAKRDAKNTLVIAALDDEYSAKSAARLAELSKGTLHIYDEGGHGTQLFAGTDLSDRLRNWLKSL